MRTSKQISSKKFSLATLIGEQLFGRWQSRVAAAALGAAACLVTADASAQILTLNSGIDSNIVGTQTMAAPNIQNALDTVTLDGGADLRYALVKYDNLFGNGVGQVPVGATILGAHYQVKTGGTGNNKSPNPFSIYRLSVPLPDPTTLAWYNSFGADGVQVGSETVALADSTRSGGGALSTTVNFDVTSSLQFWSAQVDPNVANQGWMINQVGTDGWVYASSDNAVVENRPTLNVYYTTNAGLQNLTWNAATTSGTLNTVSTNTIWSDPLNAPAAFRTGDTIVLSQNAASPVTITVANEAGGITPAATNVSHNSGTYTLTGGPINLSLNKSNAGTLVLASANNFNSVSLGGGVVELGANNALGSVGIATLSGGVIVRPTVTQSTSKDFDFTNGTIDVGPGLGFTVSGITYGTGTVNKTGTGTLTLQSGASSFTGTMDIQAGRVIVTDTDNDIVTGGDLNASSIIVRNGAAFQFGSATPISENPDLPNSTVITVETGGTADWYIGENFGGFNLQGGTVNIGGGGPNLTASSGIIESGQINGIGILRSFDVGADGQFNKLTAGTVTVTNADINATGPMNIFEGTLSTDANITGTGVLFLGNTSPATLQLRGANGLTVTKTLSLGTAGGTIEVESAAAVKIWNGNFQGDGALNKTGPGELRLTGTDSTARNVNVTGGRLAVNTGSIATGSTVTVGDGTTFQKLTTGLDSVAALTLGSTTGGNLRLALDSSVTTALITVTNNDGLIINGSNGISLDVTSALAIGTYPLLDYTGVIGGTGFAGLSLPSLPPRTLGNLVNNLVDTRVDFQVTGTDSVKWNGNISGVWDINTVANWKLASNSNSTTYLQASIPGDVVMFDDTAAGTKDVVLDTAVSPASVTFANATASYTMAGTGKITGATGITKSGAGSVVLGNNNDYIGNTSISEGTLTFTGNNTLIGSVNQTGGTLGFTGTNTLSGAVTISGGSATFGAGNTINQVLTNSGGTLTVTGANTINAVTLSGGTTIISATNALGASGTINISNAAVLRATGAISSGRGLTVGTGGAVVDVQGTDVFSMTGATAGSQQLTKTGTGTWEIMGTSSFTGALDITAGSVILQGSVAVPTGGDLNATSITVQSGARFQFGQTLDLPGENPDLPGGTVINVEAGGVVDWNVGEDFGGINLNGGTINYLRGNTNLTNAAVNSTWTSGTLNSSTATGLGAGVGNIYKTSSGIVTVNGASIGSTGLIAIEEGTLSTNGAISATAGILSLGSGSTSGTLQLRHTTPTTIAKGLVVEANGGTIDVTQAATTITMSGAITDPTSGISGNLTKTGLGRLILSGANTSTGPVSVAQGNLAVGTTGLSTSSVVSVANGATLERLGTGTLAFAGLNLGTAMGGANLLIDLSTALPTAAPLNVTTADAVVVNGTNSLSIKSTTPLTIGTYQLLDYNNSLGGSGFGGLNLVLPPRLVANLVNNMVDTRVELNVTAVDFIKWNGTAGNTTWDINTTSAWKLASDSSTTTYLQPDTIGDTVVFDDTAAGSTTVTLNTAVNPAALTFDNPTLNYTISGTGAIGGTTGLVKNGAGTVVLATNNTFTGTTVINAGKLQIGNGGTAGAIGTNTITVGATGKLEFNRSDNTTLTNVFTGTGEIIHSGTGMTTLSSNSSGFTGTVAVNAGTLRLTNLAGTHNFNATSIVVNNGGTFDFFGPAGDANLPNSTYVTVNTGGIVNWTEGETFGGINVQGGTLNLTAGVTLNGAVANQFTAGTLNGPSAIAGSTAITKTTTGIVTVNGSGLNNTGGLNIVAGTISTDAAIINTGTLTFGDATLRGTLQLRTATSGTISKVISVNAGGGVLDIQQSGTTITSSGAATLIGNGTLVKSGAGTLIRTGATTYGNNAAVQVDAGTLTLSPTVAPTIGTGVSLVIAAGAVANVGGTINPLAAGGNRIDVNNTGTFNATSANITSGNITGTGTTNVTTASATLTATSIRQSVLSIGATSQATVTPSLGNKPAGISVFTNTAGTSLSIAAGGNFDVNDNDLIVYYQAGQGATTLATIQQQIIDGFLGTSGVAKISTSTGAVDMDKFLVAIDNGGVGLTDWEGVSLTGTDQIIVKYTLFGDLNLDGSVDSFDYSVIDSNFGTGNSWLTGDSNLDGMVDSFDYSTVDTHFGKSFPMMGGGAGASLSIAAVPEPSTFVLGGLAVLGLAGYRLRRKTA